MEEIKDECGVFGIYNNEEAVFCGPLNFLSTLIINACSNSENKKDSILTPLFEVSQFTAKPRV